MNPTNQCGKKEKGRSADILDTLTGGDNLINGKDVAKFNVLDMTAREH
ncbi:hypothetical protein [Microbulbifer sp. VAAF005]|nr:hypothetical protein [Microbulbifer sp. VAAF005]WHI47260.1 hypothetical protein P0078_02465 [Microbulbifer sp. VAAF005]